MPLQWLSGKCGDLFQQNFVVSNMASVVDIMDKVLYEIFTDGEKLIGKDFMMGIFYGIKKKLLPQQEYLDFMFNDKQGSLVGSCK